jgi:hypothetical protein
MARESFLFLSVDFLKAKDIVTPEKLRAHQGDLFFLYRMLVWLFIKIFQVEGCYAYLLILFPIKKTSVLKCSKLKIRKKY